MGTETKADEVKKFLDEVCAKLELEQMDRLASSLESLDSSGVASAYSDVRDIQSLISGGQSVLEIINIVEMYYFAMIGSSIKEHMDKLGTTTDANGNTVANVELFNTYLYTAMQFGTIDEKTFADICSYVNYYCTNIEFDYKIYANMYDYFTEIDAKYMDMMEPTVIGALVGDDV